MSIFTKPMSQISATDLRELLDDGAIENIRLEFKLEVPAKDETLKKLSSFANTFGGFMVVGAKASSADGRVESLPGVDSQSGYKQKVVDWCYTGATPPLTVEVSDPIAVENGKVCYVLHISESDVAPHFLNGRKGIWVRADEFSARFEARLANEDELRHLLDRRKLILERRFFLLARARHRLDTFVGKTQTPRAGPARFGSRLELCVVPRFPARPLCEQEKLKPLIAGSAMQWRQGSFPNPGGGIVAQHESVTVTRAATDLSGGFSLLEANVWGMLFYATRIDGDENGIYGILVYRVAGVVLLFIKHAGMVLQSLGHSGPVLVETRLASIRGAQWLHGPSGRHAPMGMTYTHAGAELDDEVQFSITTSTEAILNRPDGLAMDVLRLILFSVNWPDEGDMTKTVEDLIFKAYNFNFWPIPSKLAV